MVSSGSRHTSSRVSTRISSRRVTHKLERTMIESLRAATHSAARKLQTLTEQPMNSFTTVALKESLDSMLIPKVLKRGKHDAVTQRGIA
jgi:hypothetical protein